MEWLGSAAVRLALMIEGQEGVTWDDWLALADACEANGVEALFRSDHYVSGSDESRPVLDAWTTLAGLAARTSRSSWAEARSPAPPARPSGSRTSTTRSSRRPTSSGSGRRASTRPA